MAVRVVLIRLYSNNEIILGTAKLDACDTHRDDEKDCDSVGVPKCDTVLKARHSHAQLSSVFLKAALNPNAEGWRY